MASYSSPGFSLPDEYNYSPPPPPPSSGRGFTFSQPAAPSYGGFDAGSGDSGYSAPSPSFGGGGAPRSAYSPIAPGSRGLSSTSARGGIPRGYSAYAWGQQMGRAFARKRWKDMMMGGTLGRRFPMPPQ